MAEKIVSHNEQRAKEREVLSMETDALGMPERVVFRANNGKAQFKDLVNETVKLWRKAHLDYDQISYVVKQARKALDIRKYKKQCLVVQRLSQEEAQKLINTAYEKKGLYGLMLKTLFFTGCRVNEFCNIKVDHVNFSEAEVYVQEGKGGKQRYVPIFPFLRDEIRTHVGDRKAGYLFETRLNDRFSTRRVQQVVKELSAEAGINRKVYPHLLRKSIATFLLNKGMPIDQVQQFLGHSKLETTQIYAQTSIQSLKDNYVRLIK